MTAPRPIAELEPDTEVHLPADGAWPEAVHLFEARDVWALKAAEAANRPLLVRGLPGTGKSQLARALARFTGRLFISQVVNARTEPEDLAWHFDAVARLGEAHTLGALGRGSARKALDPRRFLSPGPLWWAFDHADALAQNRRSHHPAPAPSSGLGSPEHGAVLLIDEIDKAEADLPNGLLEALGNGGFAVPYRAAPVRQDPARRPIVIVTTNEDRELPGAFVRRCLVLRLELPDTETAFRLRLGRRGARHHPYPATGPGIRKAVAQRLWDHRVQAKEAGVTPPGQAEYLDILRALAKLTAHIEDPRARAAEQRRRLGDIAEFALDKARQPD